MNNLQVGDRIQTYQNKYEAVYAFAHAHATFKTDFLEIHTSDGSHLEVTSEHLLYVSGKSNPVRASSIQKGDQLAPFDTTVTKINPLNNKKGIYAPLTASGTLIVNSGILASSYAVLVQDTNEYAHFQDGTQFLAQHDGIHLFLAPFRMVCRGKLAMGLHPCNSYKENGMPPYVDGGIRILRWANDQTVTAQILLCALAYPVFGLFMVLEQIVFHNGLSLLLLVFLGLGVASKKRAKNKAV